MSVRRWVTRHPDVRVINLDALTYAGNLANLKDIEGARNHRFVKMDIRDTEGVTALMKEENVDSVMHLAAESHVDRSISGPMAFLETNIMGTASMLSAARAAWMHSEGGMAGKRFHHVSTDEVYGSLGETGFFTEHPLRPAVPTAPPRPPATTSSGPGTTPMGCRWCCRIVPTTTRFVPISREAHPTLHPQRGPEEAAAGLRTGRERAGLAVG